MMRTFVICSALLAAVSLRCTPAAALAETTEHYTAVQDQFAGVLAIAHRVEAGRWDSVATIASLDLGATR